MLEDIDLAKMFAKTYTHDFLSVQPSCKAAGYVFQMVTRYPLTDGVEDLYNDDGSKEENKKFFPKMAFSIEKSVVAEENEVVNRRYIEYKLFEQFPKVKIKRKELLHRLIQLSGSVAKQTRRGAANILVLNTETFVDIEEKIAQRNYKTVIDKEVPKDKMYLLYAGTNVFDRAAIYCPYIYIEDNSIKIKHRAVVSEHAHKYGYCVTIE